MEIAGLVPEETKHTVFTAPFPPPLSATKIFEMLEQFSEEEIKRIESACASLVNDNDIMPLGTYFHEEVSRRKHIRPHMSIMQALKRSTHRSCFSYFLDYVSLCKDRSKHYHMLLFNAYAEFKTESEFKKSMYFFLVQAKDICCDNTLDDKYFFRNEFYHKDIKTKDDMFLYQDALSTLEAFEHPLAPSAMDPFTEGILLVLCAVIFVVATIFCRDAL